MLNPKVDFYFHKEIKWKSEIEKLREIIIPIELQEVLKWGCPCYALVEKNVILLHTFKEYCAILFFKGVLIKDENNLLIQQSENVQSARQMRFSSLNEIMEKEEYIKSYIHRAIQIEKSGLKVELKKTAEYTIPEEFKIRLETVPELNKAFKSLTPGRQRAYLMHFSQPKQSKTRESRIENAIPKILIGKGLLDE